MTTATMPHRSRSVSRPSASPLAHAVVRVVVADDSPVYAAPIVRRMAADPRWDVAAVAERGDDALRAVRALRPDLVVLDVRMPGMDGVAVAEALRADAATDGIRIVLLTGDPQGDRAAAAAAVDAVLDKALSRRALLERLHEIGSADAVPTGT